MNRSHHSRPHYLEVLAEAMWQLHTQEKDWDELIPLEQEQMQMEAQHCVEALQSAGWAIIAQATMEEFYESTQRILGQLKRAM